MGGALLDNGGQVAVERSIIRGKLSTHEGGGLVTRSSMVIGAGVVTLRDSTQLRVVHHRCRPVGAGSSQALSTLSSRMTPER